MRLLVVNEWWASRVSRAYPGAYVELHHTTMSAFSVTQQNAYLHIIIR
jgi:hypothetical protein